MAINNERALSLISLSAKAGKCVSGGFMTEKSIQEGMASLVIIANDASDNTKKKFSDKCKYYDIPFVFLADGDTLGHRIGKQSRMVIAINDNNFAKQIICKLDSSKDMEV